jgi:hypothetical protein
MATYNLFLQGVVNRLLYLTYNPFPLDLAYFDRLTIIIVTQFITYIKKACSLMFLILKYMCHFGFSLKKLNLKAKHKIKNKILWLFFNALSLVISYLLTYLG